VRATALAFAIVVLGTSGRAQAQCARPVAYEAPPACPPRAALGARLDEYLRSAPPGAVLPAIDARVRITGAFEAEIVLVDGGDETRRSISDPSCSVLVDAAALIVAVALVPDLAVVLAPPRPPRDREQDLAPETPAPSTSALGGAIWLGAHGSLGVLPGVVVGGELGGAVRSGALRIEAAVRGVPLVGARFAVDPSIGGELGIVVVLARVLGVAVLDPVLELRGGGGVEAGVALGRGVGITDPRDASAPWVAIEAAVGAAWVPWPAVALVLDVEALVPIVRPVFTVAGTGTLFRPEPVAGAVRLALELRFP
jgi:hypothetical protein